MKLEPGCIDTLTAAVSDASVTASCPVGLAPTTIVPWQKPYHEFVMSGSPVDAALAVAVDPK